MATVEKRGKSYRITVSAGYDRNGKQIRRKKTWTPHPGLTKRQEEKELQRQTVLFEESIKNTGDGHIRVEDFSKRYMEEYVEKNLRTYTADQYRFHLARVNAALGHLYIDKVTPRHISDFLENLAEPGINKKDPTKGLSAKTISNYRTFLRAMFSYAVRLDLIQRNPCSRAPMPTAAIAATKRDYYTIEEAQAILNTLPQANTKLRTFIILAMFCGYRKEELCGLEWKDIDFEAQTIAINRVYVCTLSAGCVTGQPKTRAGARVGKQQPIVFDALREWKAEQDQIRERMGDNWTETDRVFTNDKGLPGNPSSFNSAVQRHCQKHGLRSIGIHAFRHLNAALRISAGADPVTVAAAMGHANPTITLNTYAYEFSHAVAASSEAVADALTNKPQANPKTTPDSTENR